MRGHVVTLIPLLLLLPVVSGCLSSAQEDVATQSLVPSSIQDSSLDWQLHMDNDTKLIRFDTSEGLEITRTSPGLGKNWVAGSFILGGGYRLGFGYENSTRFQVQDYSWTPPEGFGILGGGGSGWGAPGWSGPGVYHIVFHASGMPVTFHITSDNATYDVLHDESTTFRFIEQDHEDWDRFLHVHAGIVHFSAAMDLTPDLGTIQLVLANFGLVSDAEVDLGYETCSSTVVRAYTDEEVTVTVESTDVLGPSAVRLFLIETSFDLGKRGCYGGQGL